jgi:hypothetical protein
LPVSRRRTRTGGRHRAGLAGAVVALWATFAPCFSLDLRGWSVRGADLRRAQASRRSRGDHGCGAGASRASDSGSGSTYFGEVRTGRWGILRWTVPVLSELRFSRTCPHFGLRGSLIRFAGAAPRARCALLSSPGSGALIAARDITSSRRSWCNLPLRMLTPRPCQTEGGDPDTARGDRGPSATTRLGAAFCRRCLACSTAHAALADSRISTAAPPAATQPPAAAPSATRMPWGTPQRRRPRRPAARPRRRAPPERSRYARGWRARCGAHRRRRDAKRHGRGADGCGA